MDPCSCNFLDDEVQIKCSPGGRITYLYLNKNNLEGPVPAALAELPDLTYINLDGNALTGEIPPALVNLTKLKCKEPTTCPVRVDSGSSLTYALYLVVRPPRSHDCDDTHSHTHC